MPHPGQLFFVKGLPLALAFLCQFNPGRFLGYEVLIVAVIMIKLAKRQLPDMIGNLIQKVAVMRNDQHGPAIAGQIVLQPHDRVDVQMVGWLIQHQQIGFLNQNLGQANPLALTTGKLLDFLVGVIDFQLR